MRVIITCALDLTPHMHCFCSVCWLFFHEYICLCFHFLPSLVEVKKKKKAPPRVFCDICDCFDLHDTEDCPTQTQSPDSPPHSSYRGRRSDERPYCDICEAFGHATESCNDDQTFWIALKHTDEPYFYTQSIQLRAKLFTPVQYLFSFKYSS